MPDGTANATSISTFVDMLNSVTSTPTSSLTAYLHAAVVHGGVLTKTALFSSDEAANLYDDLAVPSVRDALQDFSLLMVAYCASHTAGTIYGDCFNKLNGNTELEAWFAAHGQEVGNALAVQHLLKKVTWDDPLASGATVTCQQLIARDGFTDELKRRLGDGRLLAALAGAAPSGSVVVPVKLLMLLLETWYAADAEIQKLRLDLLTDTKGPYYSFVAGYDEYDWLAGIAAAFKTEGAEYKTLQPSVRLAMVSVRTTSSPDSVPHETYYNEYGPIIPYSGGTTTTRIGEDMKSWLSSNSSDYFVNTNPNNTTSEHHGGCVKAGTLIMVAPNVMVPIEDIAEGTPVYSVGGAVSFTSAELVRNDTVTDFYAVNDDEPFLSFEHPILTQDGFKCLDPDTARMISPDAPVSLLCVGDVVNRSRLDADGTVVYSTEVVRRIRTEHVEGVVSYDLHFKEGYNSYHANGYACLLNYPALTVASAEERLSYLFNREERRGILKRLAADDALRRIVGDTTVAYLEQMVANPVPKLKVAENGLLEGGEAPRLRFRRVVFDDGPACSSPSPSVADGLSLYRNRLFGSRGAEPLDMERRGRRVFFSLPSSSDGQPGAGVLNLVHDGLMAKGALMENGTVRRFTAFNDDQFALRANGELVGKLAIEHIEDAERAASAPAVVLYLLDPDTGSYARAAGCTCSIGTRTLASSSGTVTHRRCIDVNIPVLGTQLLGCARVPLPNHVYLLFDALFMTACEDGRLGETHGITAELIEDDDLERFDAAITCQGRAEPPLAHRLYGLPKPLLEARQEEDLVSALGLCVEELYSLPAPESLSAIHQNSFASLMNMMYYRADDAVLEIFGRTRPTVGKSGELSPEEGALADGHGDFLKDDFAVGYTCNSLQAWDDEYLKDLFASIPQASEKLDYYLNGDDDPATLGASADYGAIMSKLNVMHYRTCIPDLAKYANDSSRNWGAELYAYGLREENKNNRGLLCSLEDQANGDVKHVSNMLDVLDAASQVQVGERTVSYAAAYESAIFDCQATCAARMFSSLPSHLAPDDFMPAARDLAGRLYDAAFKGSSYCGSQLPDALAAEVRQEAEGMSRDDYIEGSASTIKAGLMATQLGEDQWFRWMNTNGTAKVVVFMGLLSAASIVALIYSTPESLSGKELANIIATVLETLGGAADVYSLYSLHKIVKASDMTVEDVLQALEYAERGLPPMRRFADGGGDLVFDDTVGNIVKVEGFKLTRAFLKLLNVGLSAVFAYLSIADVIDGWESDTPARRAFAVIDAVANTVLFGVALIELVGLACPLVSAIGGVCVVVSIVCQVFLLLLPKKHEPSTSEKYVANVGRPFIERLPAPSQFYLEKKKLLDDYAKASNLAGMRLVVA